MSPFVIIRYFYVFLMLGLLIAFTFFIKIEWWYFVIPSLLFFFLIGIGSYYIGLNFFIKAQNSFKTKEKSIALTFDDGPDATITPLILDLLSTYNAKATFFCIGKKIAENKNLVQKIHKKGHSLANHSFTHRNLFPLYGKTKLIEEITSTNELLTEICGIECTLFRPPFGVTNPTIAFAIKKMKMKAIGWNIRSLDTTFKDSEKVINRVIKRIKPGAIILLHDDRQNTPEILEAILQYTQRNKFSCVLIPEKK